MQQTALAMDAARDELAALVRSAGTPAGVVKKLPGWARTTSVYEPIGDAIFVPAVMAELAGQLMVYGHEARVVQLDVRDPVAFLDLPWDAAIAEWKARGLQSDAEFSSLIKGYAQRSDIARRLMLDQVQAFMRTELEQAITHGSSLAEFADNVASGDVSLGITADDPAYLETVFRTNVQAAYGAGRYRAMSDPDVLDARPFIQYRTVDDALVRPSHELLHLVVWHHTSAGWRRCACPNGFRCRCSQVTLSADEAKGFEIIDGVPAGGEPDPGFDGPPVASIDDAAPITPSRPGRKVTVQVPGAANTNAPANTNAQEREARTAAAQRAAAKVAQEQADAGRSVVQRPGPIASPVPEAVAQEVATAMAAAHTQTGLAKVDAALGSLSEAKRQEAATWVSGWAKESTDAGAAELTNGLKTPGSWAQATYSATQHEIARQAQLLRERGIMDDDGYVTVYRGIYGEHAQAARDADLKTGDAITVPVRSVSSWTTDRAVAERFAVGKDGLVLGQRVHHSRAFATLYGNAPDWGVHTDTDITRSEWLILNDGDEIAATIAAYKVKGTVTGEYAPEFEPSTKKPPPGR